MKAHSLLPTILLSLLPLAAGCAADADDTAIRVELRGATAQAWELTGPIESAPDVAAALADQLGADDPMADGDTTAAITLDDATTEVLLDAAVGPDEVEAIAADHGFVATPVAVTPADGGKDDNASGKANPGRVARAEVANYTNRGRDSYAVFAPKTGMWSIDAWSGTFTRITRQWGMEHDRPVLGDYDKDGKTDVAVWRPSDGKFYVWTMTGARWGFQWGVATDLPVPGDYDGDKQTDFAVYRPSTCEWRILKSSSGNTQTQLSTMCVNGGTLVPGDYDGDGRSDPAYFRGGVFTWRPSSGGADRTRTLGTGSDTPVPGDYDNDGKTDPAVFSRYGEWQVQESRRNYALGPVSVWGYASDTPTVGDHDGDGKVDYSVFRPSDGKAYTLRYNGQTITRTLAGAYTHIAATGPYRYAPPVQL